MYWPVGIPNIYSVTKHAAAVEQTQTEDGLEHSEHEAAARTNGTQSDRHSADDSTLEASSLVKARNKTHWTERILALGTSRGGHIFATITRSTLSVWQTKPTVLLATVARSKQSLDAYGENVAVLVRSDALIVVVQTRAGFLITYSLASDPNAQVYKLHVRPNALRRQSGEGIRRTSHIGPDYGVGDGNGIRDISVRFRMAIRIDAGISKALALDDELVVATVKPPAIQVIRWSPDKSGSSHNTELLKKMPWFSEGATVADMIYDRPMGLHVWISSDGRAYAVQRTQARLDSDGGNANGSMFKGYCFHTPTSSASYAVKAAVNPRFSLIAVACADSTLRVYAARDYLGNIPLSHVLHPPADQKTSGLVTFIEHSPDGLCTFAGFEHGWAIWSVYGKRGATSFAADSPLAPHNDWWLRGVSAGFWAGGGADLVLLSLEADQLCSFSMARSAINGCFDMANIHRSLLVTSSSLMIHRGNDEGSDSTVQDAHWQTLQLPRSYTSRQWPIKCAVVSSCGKYIAAAGRRGLVHYSNASGRWKVFEDVDAENAFAVRGGMSWYQHILVAAVVTDGQYQIRLYSREANLGHSSALHIEPLQSPVIHMTLADASSLLVYTHENVLFHYVFDVKQSAVNLVKVGQIGFHGIIRAPARVRSVSWIVPDEQRERGEPSQDVTTAAVLFLIDGKLVLLHPSPEEHRELKYDMRVVAQNVEYYLLARQGYDETLHQKTSLSDMTPSSVAEGSLHDSLWYFDGQATHVWPDVQELISSTSSEIDQQTAPSVLIPTDFYPLSPLLDAGTITGLESELIQPRSTPDLSHYRTASRTHLFIPALLAHHFSRFDAPAAQHLAESYSHLPYFAHALEILLHDTLDADLESSSSASGQPDPDSRLASLLPFLSSFPAFPSVIVNYARKTELRSWTYLFAHLPPVAQLFDAALQRGDAHVAAGLLLVLHTFDQGAFERGAVGRLMALAKEQGDWGLAREVARFLVGVDEDGEWLRAALKEAGMGRDTAR